MVIFGSYTGYVTKYPLLQKLQISKVTPSMGITLHVQIPLPLLGYGSKVLNYVIQIQMISRTVSDRSLIISIYFNKCFDFSIFSG